MRSDLSSMEPSLVWKISLESCGRYSSSWLFDIFADEEIRIRKARAEHVFIALADGVDADVVAVADGDEMGQ